MSFSYQSEGFASITFYSSTPGKILHGNLPETLYFPLSVSNDTAIFTALPFTQITLETHWWVGMPKLLFWRCAKNQKSLLPYRKSIIGAPGGINKLKNNSKTSVSGQGGERGTRFTFLPETTNVREMTQTRKWWEPRHQPRTVTESLKHIMQGQLENL